MSEAGFSHLVRVASTDVRGDKPVKYALAEIKGIGRYFAVAILRSLGIDENQRIGFLPDDVIKKIEEAIYDPVKAGVPAWLVNRKRDPKTGEDLHLIGADLSLQHKQDIEAMIKMKSWRGIRHARGLKVRGQKLKSNGRKGLSLGVRRKR